MIIPKDFLCRILNHSPNLTKLSISLYGIRKASACIINWYLHFRLILCFKLYWKLILAIWLWLKITYLFLCQQEDKQSWSWAYWWLKVSWKWRSSVLEASWVILQVILLQLFSLVYIYVVFIDYLDMKFFNFLYHQNHSNYLYNYKLIQVLALHKVIIKYASAVNTNLGHFTRN